MIEAGRERPSVLPAAPPAPPEPTVPEAASIPPAAVAPKPLEVLSPATDVPTAPVFVAAVKAAVRAEHPADPAAIWKQVQDRATGRAQRTLLGKVALESLSEGVALLVAPASCVDMLSAFLEEIGTSLFSATGSRWTIEVRAIADPVVEVPRAAPAVAIDDNPLVKQAAELFGARVVSVQPRKPGSTPGAPAPAPAAPVPDPADSATIDHSGDE